MYIKNKRKLEAEILRKLARHKYWGGKHTSIDNILKSFKKHLSKEVIKVTKSLIKEGYIIQKKNFLWGSCFFKSKKIKGN